MQGKHRNKESNPLPDTDRTTTPEEWDYNRSKTGLQPADLKEWNSYTITDQNGRWALNAAVIHTLHVFLISISVIDYTEKAKAGREYVKIPMPNRLQLPSAGTQDGSFTVSNEKLRITLIRKNTRHHVMFCVPDLILPDGRTGIDADITLTQSESAENIKTFVPSTENRRLFLLKETMNCMEADGKVRFGDDITYLNQSRASGLFDCGYGYRSLDRTLFRACAGTEIQGEAFGFVLECGQPEHPSLTGNCIFFKNTTEKPETVFFNLPESGSSDCWLITSPDKRIKITFRPVTEEICTTDYKIRKHSYVKVFGCFDGTAAVGDGNPVKFKNIPGFVEKHR